MSTEHNPVVLGRKQRHCLTAEHQTTLEKIGERQTVKIPFLLKIRNLSALPGRNLHNGKIISEYFP